MIPKPPQKADSPRALAEARAAEILGQSSAFDEGNDRFYVDASKIPDGWTYEWKTRTIYNKEDPAYQVNLARTGWTTVPRTRHPEMMPAGHLGDTIEVDGQVLMERPEMITAQVRGADARRARDQVRAKEEQLGAAPPGHFERDTNRSTRPKVSRSYEPMPIPT